MESVRGWQSLVSVQAVSFPRKHSAEGDLRTRGPKIRVAGDNRMRSPNSNEERHYGLAKMNTVDGPLGYWRYQKI